MHESGDIIEAGPLRPLLKSPTFWRGISLSAACALLCFTVSIENANTIANVARFLLALAVSVAYWTPFFRAIRASIPRWGHHLVLGIQLSWLSDAALGAYAGLFWYAGRPEWWTHHWLIGRLSPIFVSWGVLGAVLHMTVPDRIAGGVPRRNALLFAVTVSTIALVAILTIVAQRSAG